MMPTALSRLQPVDLRSVWSSEASGFTPWLGQEENLRLLGEAIGVELELEAQEKEVGPFRADLLCKDTATEHWVLIENQLEQTDHTHLGQILTYAAGLKAATIVWVARSLRDEHRAALDWLNEITDPRFNFFGLEIELWRIGDSAPAPKFNVVSKPNDWSRDVSKAAARVDTDTLSEAKQLQLRFWNGFRDYARQHARRIRPTKPLPQNWMNVAIGRTGIKLAAIASTWDSESESYDQHEIRAELVLHDQKAKDHYEALLGQREEIESSLGRLHWHNPDASLQCKIYDRQSVNLEDDARWPEHFEWLTSRLDGFHEFFQPLVRSL